VEAYVDTPVHPGWRTFDPTPPSGAQPLEPPNGIYYYARDFVEALSQRWNTYVVGYDLRKQVHMFDEVSQRYERLRLAGSPRVPIVVGSLALAFGLGYVAWRRRRNAAADPRDANASKRRQHARVTAAVALYRALETALHAHGVTRPASLPPLRHAEELRERRHPLAVEVLALTNVYLASRFGGQALTEASKRDFERRVREIRAFRSERVAQRQA
jgi:hypothetical protein